MSGWLAIGLVVIGLVAVAVMVLVFDVIRGDVGGGRHTLARARRLLVVGEDDATLARAEGWVAEQRRENPLLQCFVLSNQGGSDLYMAIEEVVQREHPDAIVFARHAEERHKQPEGVYGRLREGQSVPVEAIYVGEEAAAP
jgi:hypothetical protein